MQPIIVEKPYRFVPPHRGSWVPSLIQKFRLIDWYLNRYEGITSYEIRGAERLKASLEAGHGILLTANHCRYADPIAMGWLARETNTHLYAMASWHLFNDGWWKAQAIRWCGGFSVYREGIDRRSLDTAIDTLVEARRPLVLFPEGTVMRSNDVLHPLLDGVSFITRTAARKRAKLMGEEAGQVVVHPVAIKYLLRGNVDEVVRPALKELEERLLVDILYDESSVLDRVRRLSQAQLALNEIRFLGEVQNGGEQARRDRLVKHLLNTSEARWGLAPQSGQLLPRIKSIRMQLVKRFFEPDELPDSRNAVWRTLQDLYVAQQIASHPVGYLDQPTDIRVLETVERIEEDLKDRSRVFRPLHAILQVAPPIRVEGDKLPRGVADPIVETITSELRSMLAGLSTEALPYSDAGTA